MGPRPRPRRSWERRARVPPARGLRSRPRYLATRLGEPTLTRETNRDAAAEGRGGRAKGREGGRLRPELLPPPPPRRWGGGTGEDVTRPAGQAKGPAGEQRMWEARRRSFSLTGAAAAGGGDVAG